MEVGSPNLLLFSKGKGGKDVWDDTALQKAYDKAYDVLKSQVGTVESGSDPPKKIPKGNKKKTRKKNSGKANWKIGDRCVSEYGEDGLFYNGRVISIEGNKCVVKYDYYENEEDKLLSELTRRGKKSNLRQTTSNTYLQSPTPPQKSPIPSHQSTSQQSSSHNSPSPTPPDFNHSHTPTSPNHIPCPLPSSESPNLPCIPPPPLPSLPLPPEDRDTLYSMLTSWYMSGYYTGFYKGRQEVKVNK